MKQLSKSLLSSIICLALVLGFTACGTPSGSTSGTTPSAASAPGSLSAAPASTAAPVPTEPAEVVFWHSFSGKTGEAFESIIKDYNEGPGKEKQITVVPVFQGYEGTDKVVLAYQTKDTQNAPDINVGLTSTIPSVMDMGWSVPASRFLGQNGSIDKDAFYEPLQRSCTYMGDIAAVPFANSIPLLYYNIDVLKEAGYDKAPETFDEMIEYVKKLTVKEGNNVARYGLNMQTKRYHLVEFCVSQKPDSFFGDNEGGRSAPMTRIIAGENGTLKAYLTQLKALLETGGYKSVEDKINDEFAQGLHAMVIMSSSRLGTLDGLMPGKYAAAFIPKVNAGDNGGAAVGGSCLNMFDRGDENRLNAAWDVVQYVTNPESQYTFATASGYIPVNVKTEELPQMQAYYKEYPQYKVPLDQMKAASPLSQEPLDLTYNEINGIITEIMLEFCDGKLTVDEAVEKIVSQCNASLDEYHAANS